MQRNPSNFHIRTVHRSLFLRALVLLTLVALLSLHAPRSVDAQEVGIAAVAPILSYQGRLAEPGTNAPKPNGTYTFVFRIYDVSNGGSELWSETKDIAVQNGLFTTELGSVTAFPANLFDGKNLWLGIKVGADPEATPRQRLTPVAYALYSDNADRLDGLHSTDFATAGHLHDGRYYTKAQSDARYVNTSGGAISGKETTVPVLSVENLETHDGIFAVTQATGGGRAAIRGVAGSPSVNISSAAGVFGSSVAARGVIGTSTNSTGVFGFSVNNYALEGQAPSTGLGGVLGTSFGGPAGTAGVYGNHTATSGVVYGVRGRTSSGSGYGVYGEAVASSGTTYGVFGVNSSGGGAGVRGNSNWVGVWGDTSGRWGIYGRSTGASNSYGVYGTVVSGSGNYAGYFAGNVNVTGSLSKGSGTFKIDHPLDPENKYLSHSFVESPDMMNVYNGNVTLDGSGQAWVDLPTYFQALNRDFRYQLTPIGGPGPNLHIAEQISGNRFRIAGGTPGLLVSWQVTGIRQDAFANANRVVVEEDKPANERGSYLHPEVFGLDKSRSVDAKLNSIPMDTMQPPAQNEQVGPPPRTQPDTQ